jgi:hypothetical protein
VSEFADQEPMIGQTYYNTTTTTSASGFGAAILIVLLIELVIGGFVIFALSRILKKAGYSPWLCLLGIIPIVNIVMFFVFAFAEWPVLYGRQSSGGGYGYGPPPGSGWQPPQQPGPYSPGMPSAMQGTPPPPPPPPAPGVPPATPWQ